MKVLRKAINIFMGIFPKRTTDLTIFMRSGNRIELDRIEHWEIGSRGDEIARLKLTMSDRSKSRLLVQTIALSQIEAVVEHRR